MKLNHVFNSIRARITLWHLGVLVATLLVYMLLNQGFLWHQLTIELKDSLRDDVEVVESFLRAAEDGGIVWSGHDDTLVNDGQERWIEVRGLAGGLVYRNFPQEGLFSSLQVPSRQLHEKTFHPLRLADGEDLLVVQEVHEVAEQGVEILVGRSRERLSQEMGHLLVVQALGFPAVILLAWVGGFILAGRVLSPLKKIIARTKTISAERLHERLPVENPQDELGQLSLSFNELLGKLDRSFGQMRQFTADASHELRTPLAAIRSVGEMALRTPRAEADYQETIGSMLEEVEKMTVLVNDLLALARSDSGILSPTFEITNLGDVVGDEVSLLKVLAEEKAQRLTMEIEHPCPVQLDRGIFRQAVSNILHNAIKYTPEGKNIRILAGKTSAGCYVEIADSGPGIEPEHRERIFDRFYRVDKVRSRETGGSGLGLAIAKWAVDVHGGRIDLTSEPGSGSTFRIELPARAGINA